MYSVYVRGEYWLHVYHHEKIKSYIIELGMLATTDMYVHVHVHVDVVMYMWHVPECVLVL